MLRKDYIDALAELSGISDASDAAAPYISTERLMVAIMPPDGARAETIKVFIVDEAAALLQHVQAALAGEMDIELIGAAQSGPDALTAVPALRPDVLLLSMDLPVHVSGPIDQGNGHDSGATIAADLAGTGAEPVGGAALAEAIMSQFPFVSAIMTSQSGDPEQLRRAMRAGARHFLVKPFGGTELAESIRSVYRLDASRRAAHAGFAKPALAVPASPRSAAPASREGKIYTFYSAKGGAGCTTLACNTAVALKRLTGKEVALFDCGLLFGDVGVVLNLNPRTTIVDLLPQLQTSPGPLDLEFLSQMMVPHVSGVKVLLAPSSPEKAELVSAEHVHRVLAALRDQFDYVVIDTWPTFEERILSVLDAADKIVVPTTLEMPAIKNSKLLLDVTSALSYAPEKVLLVLNRADSRGGIRVQDVEQILQKQFAAEIVSDGRLTTHSLNEGVPFVMTNPTAPISTDISRLATILAGLSAAAIEEARPKRGGFMRAVLGA